MINRLRISNNGVVITPTGLLWHSFLKSQPFALGAAVEQESTMPPEPRLSKLDEVIKLINDIKEHWATLSSDEIQERLERACKKSDDEVTEANFSDQPEIWLLKALALEKSLTADIADIEKYYSKCRGGFFQAVLVLNNCGVVQAKRQKCAEALELFKDAMFCSYRMNKYARAPFYNFALVVDRLYKQRFIFDTDYLALLEQVKDGLPFLSSSNEPRPAEQTTEPHAAKPTLSDSEIRRLYTDVARFAREIKESQEDKFYYSKLSYLVPELDLLESFGYATDNVDREIASERFKQATALFDQGKYKESIYAFDQASMWAPDYLKGATEEIDKVSSTWRHQEDRAILDLTQKREFDEAIRRLENLPDPRLIRDFDKSLIESLYTQKQLSLLQEAEQLVSERKFGEAKLKFKQLLREDLGDHLRKYVSSSLAELLDEDDRGVSENKPA